MDYQPDCLYQLQGRTDEHTWRVVGGPFLYCELQAAKADAHRLLARYPCVRLINKTTSAFEYMAQRVYPIAARQARADAPTCTHPSARAIVAPEPA